MSDCKEKFLSTEADVGGIENNRVANKTSFGISGYSCHDFHHFLGSFVNAGRESNSFENRPIISYVNHIIYVNKFNAHLRSQGTVTDYQELDHYLGRSHPSLVDLTSVFLF